MFKVLFKIIISLLATIIQLVCYPINQSIVITMPNLSSKIVSTSNSLVNFISGLDWVVDLIPRPIFETLVFILGVEIAKHSIYVMTHVLIKVWNLIQKLKFW